jgi:hypothetical protein
MHLLINTTLRYKQHEKYGALRHILLLKNIQPQSTLNLEDYFVLLLKCTAAMNKDGDSLWDALLLHLKPLISYAWCTSVHITGV